MPKISLRLTEPEFERLEMLRGKRSISDYIRALLSGDHKEAKREDAEFHQLFRDISVIREAVLKDLPDQKALLALAAYLAEVMSIANPPAYAKYEDKQRELFLTLKANLTNGGSGEKE